MNRLSGFFQFIIGFFLGVVLLAGASAAVAYMVLSKMSTPPDKPLFAEEKKQQALARKVTTADRKKTVPNPVTEVKGLEDMPTGTYKAIVSWPEGLSLRAGPSTESARLGSLGYKAELTILGTSEDGNWQKVKVTASDREGWIKAGNIQKVE
jgi:hypothetical protein